jgi:2-polyprenyl-6-methoxyphenol hydroxylase-like FAD-dependent oxidoreductase
MDATENVTDVLVVGAGPTGLAAACDAARHGLSVRVVERREARAEHSKALVVHARTMEVLERLGCADAVLARGARFGALHVHTRPGRERTRVDLLARRWGDTRYPFWLSIPQYEVERALERRLADAGVAVEWRTALEGLEQSDEAVTASLRGPDGGLVRHRARWLLGCDGGRSAARELVGISLARRALGVTFALADVETATALAPDEGHMVWADEGLLLVVPFARAGVWRLIAQVAEDGPELDAAAWNELVRRRAGFDLGVRGLGWRSRFELTAGVSAAMRRGRVFLLGDAAHVHSPVGGQGLNTGVQDAHNLVWKLRLADRGGLSPAARAALLDSYESERLPTAAAMVRATGRATGLLTSRNPLVRGLLRTIAPRALRVARLADRLGRGVGMLDLTTGGRPRLPNPVLAAGDRLHDRVDPLLPTLLRWNGQEILVRPDRVVARPGEIPHLAEARITDPPAPSPKTMAP